MAGRQNFQYAQLPIMRYRVFDSGSRQFSNVPIQPLSNYNWPPPEEDPYELFPDEQNYSEVQDSDSYDQQPLDTEVNEIEEIEIIDNPSEDVPAQENAGAEFGGDWDNDAGDDSAAVIPANEPLDEIIAVESLDDKPVEEEQFDQSALEPAAEAHDDSAAEPIAGSISESVDGPAPDSVDEPDPDLAVVPVDAGEEPGDKDVEEAASNDTQISDAATIQPVNEPSSEPPIDELLASDAAKEIDSEVVENADDVVETEEGAGNIEEAPVETGNEVEALVVEPDAESDDQAQVKGASGDQELTMESEPSKEEPPAAQDETAQGDEPATDTSATKEGDIIAADDTGVDVDSIEQVTDAQMPNEGEVAGEIVETEATSAPVISDTAPSKSTEASRRKKKDKKTGSAGRKKKKVATGAPVVGVEVRDFVEESTTLDTTTLPEEAIQETPAEESLFPPEAIQVPDEFDAGAASVEAPTDDKDSSESISEPIEESVDTASQQSTVPEPANVLEIVKDMQDADASDKEINEVLEKALSEVDEGGEVGLPAEVQAEGEGDEARKDVPGSFPESDYQEISASPAETEATSTIEEKATADITEAGGLEEVSIVSEGTDGEPAAEDGVHDPEPEQVNLEQAPDGGDENSAQFEGDEPASGTNDKQDKLEESAEDGPTEAVDELSVKEVSEKPPKASEGGEEGPLVKLCAALEETPSVEETPAVEDAGSGTLTTSDEMIMTVTTPGEDKTHEELPIMEEITATEETPPTEGNTASEQVPSASEETPATEKTTNTEETTATKETPSTDETPALKDLPIAEEIPTPEEPPAAREIPTPEEISTPQDPPPTNEAIPPADEPTLEDAPPASPPTEENPATPKDKSSPRRRHYRPKERDRQTSITNGHNTLLDRKKNEKGLFTNIFGRAVSEAKGTGRQKRETDEYREKEKQRRERKEKRAEEERERERAAREVRREERRKFKEAEEADRVARVARREERRSRQEAEKAATEIERAAAEAEAIASPPPSPKSEKKRSRRPSFPASTSSGGGTARPALIKRLTKGESEHGGPLLKLNFNKWTEEPSRLPPAEDKGKEADRGSGERKRHHRHREEGERRSKDREREQRPVSSRHVSSRSQGSGSHRKEEEIPAAKIRNAIGKGLRSVFA